MAATNGDHAVVDEDDTRPLLLLQRRQPSAAGTRATDTDASINDGTAAVASDYQANQAPPSSAGSMPPHLAAEGGSTHPPPAPAPAAAAATTAAAPPAAPHMTPAKLAAAAALASSKGHPHQQPSSVDVLTSGSRRKPDKPQEDVKDLSKFTDTIPVKTAAILLLVYMTTGLLFYSFKHNALTSSSRFVDVLYFTAVSLSTVGFGDVRPKSDSSRLFTCFFVLFGSVVIGYGIGLILTYFLDSAQAKVESMEDIIERNQFRYADAPTTDTDGDGDVDADDKPWPTPCMIWRRQSSAVRQLIKSLVLVLAMIGIGVAILMVDRRHENPSFTEALYFACITVTTVGYGDYTPTTDAGKIVCALYVLGATAVFAHAMGSVANLPLERRRRKLELKVLDQYRRGLTMKDLLSLVKGGESPGYITRSEFVLKMLYKLNKVPGRDTALFARLAFCARGKYPNAKCTSSSSPSPSHTRFHHLAFQISGEDIADISRRFDALDRWHTGRLTPEDIRTHSLWHESQAAAFIVTLRHKSRLHNLTTVVT
eukprot:m.217995 g.217995  ORF g.217995 m.217995 type:complete len:539 (-) comp18676_c0_seq6:131-1747(-)